MRYGTEESEETKEDAEKYGSVIGDWCFDESLTDLSNLFKFVRWFHADISGWNVSSVTTMSSMFLEANEFNADISGWDVSNVRDMKGMFYGAHAFSADITGWKVSSVTSMRAMFLSAYLFNVDISGWDVSSIEDMAYMFYDALSFNRDPSAWDISSVINMQGMFSGASFFNQNLCAWKDSLQVFKTSEMFSNAACPLPEHPTSADSPTFCRSCDAPSPSLSPTQLLATSCQGQRQSCTRKRDCCGNRICFSIKKKEMSRLPQEWSEMWDEL